MSRTSRDDESHLTYVAPQESCRRCSRSFINVPVGHIYRRHGGIELLCPDCCPDCS